MPPRSPEYLRIAAFDPGQRTGAVVVRVPRDLKLVHPRRLGPRQFYIKRQKVMTIPETAKLLPWFVTQADVVVYERWVLFADYAEQFIGNDMQPSQVVGMIRYATWQEQRDRGDNTPKLVVQGTGAKKAALKMMPKWLHDHMALSSEQHDQDAIMHAFYYAVNHFTRRNQ